MKEIIGILGSEPGIGVTHLSIMISNFLSSKLKKKVALVELNETLEFHNIESEQEEFRWMNVQYIPCCTQERLLAVFNESYDYYILDLGCNFRDKRYELLRSTKKIIVGSLAAWKSNHYFQLLEQLSKEVGYQNFIYLSLFGLEQEMQTTSRKYQISMQELPFVKNPYALEKGSFSFLNRLIV